MTTFRHAKHLIVAVALGAGCLAGLSTGQASAAAGNCNTAYLCVYAAANPPIAYDGEYGFLNANHTWLSTYKYSAPYAYLSVPFNDSAWWNMSTSYRACVWHGDYAAAGSYKTYDGVAGNYVGSNATWNDKGSSNRWGASNGPC